MRNGGDDAFLERRNGAAAMGAIRDMDARIREQDEKIRRMETAMSSLMIRCDELQRMIATAVQSRIGSGPTVKS